MSLAGSFLVAQSSLADPNFLQTVILVLVHNDGGAFGLVVNRPLKKADLPFPVYHGGPCPAPGLVVLHGHSEWIDAGSEETENAAHREIAPGIFLGDPACLKRASQETHAGEAVRCRAFQGYAGWGPGQLENELTEGAWQVTPAESDLLFATPMESLWRLLAPPRIPRPSAN